MCRIVYGGRLRESRCEQNRRTQRERRDQLQAFTGQDGCGLDLVLNSLVCHNFFAPKLQIYL